MSAFYPQFDVCLIDAEGYRVALPAEDLDVLNVTTSTSLGTVTTDADGIIAEGAFVASVGDIVEFSHASYPNTFRVQLTADQSGAYANVNNLETSFVVENLVTITRESTIAEIMIEDLDNPNVKPFKIAAGRAGETLEIPYQTSIEQNLRIRPISKDDKRSYASLSLVGDNYQDITIPASGGGGSSVIASVDLIAGEIVDIYNDGGTLKARKADATDNTRPANAFVSAGGLTGENILVKFAGEIVEGLSGLTQGEPCFLSETAGGVTQTPITSGTGKVSQEIGTALSATTMIFMPMEAVELA